MQAFKQHVFKEGKYSHVVTTFVMCLSWLNYYDADIFETAFRFIERNLSKSVSNPSDYRQALSAQMSIVHFASTLGHRFDDESMDRLGLTIAEGCSEDFTIVARQVPYTIPMICNI